MKVLIDKEAQATLFSATNFTDFTKYLTDLEHEVLQL